MTNFLDVSLGENINQQKDVKSLFVFPDLCNKLQYGG